MTLLSAAALFFAGLAAGALNALSGGGTFITFPSLLLAGVPAVAANATNTVAVTPGVAFSALAYRGELQKAPHRLPLALVSIVGGGLGALLLLRTPSTVFEGMVPYLLLAATLLFALGPTLGRRVVAAGPRSRRQAPGQFAALLTATFFISLYGGYFGAGLGIILHPVLSLFGLRDFHVANALRTFLAACINGVAVVAFAVSGVVWWPEAAVMLVGAIIGGYGGVRIFRRIPGHVLRRVVLGIACAMTAYFFARAH